MLYSRLRYITVLAACATGAFAQDQTELMAKKMKKLSLEELMEIEVTSVSRTPEKLAEVASGIQVITNEDVRRSSAIRLPEALRLASNLMVAQYSSHDWAITSRGFNGAPLTNNSMSSKLLVMVDGRTVYTPLFGGVFWDVQNILLEDLDKIEIISGPGGTLWGANAMNGVINVNTRSSRETQGLFVTGSAGNFVNSHLGIRYGGKAGKNLFFKIYTQRYDYDDTKLEAEDANDAWHMTQGGFRLDYYPNASNTITVQGDLYGGKEKLDSGNMQDGQNLLARWHHTFSEKSNLILQLYYDRTWRTLPGREFIDQLQTYDLDIQNAWDVGKYQRLVVGGGYRLMKSHIRNKADPQFFPLNQDMPLYQVFIQDEIKLLQDKLNVKVGVKLLNNFFSDFEWQPNLRVAWTANSTNTVWASLSRAVRAPTRFDVDISSPSVMTPGKKFKAENLIAYQLGHRWQFMEKGNLATTLFYHDYSDLRSFNLNTGAPPPLFHLMNDQAATSKGIEISLGYYVSEKWRLRGGYTFIQTEFESTRPEVFQPFSADFESVDPKTQTLIQSILDLPGDFQLDMDARYVHNLKGTFYNPAIDSYYSLNARIGREFKQYEVSIIGQNLLQDAHQEFSALSIPRSFVARLKCRF